MTEFKSQQDPIRPNKSTGKKRKGDKKQNLLKKQQRK